MKSHNKHYSDQSLDQSNVHCANGTFPPFFHDGGWSFSSDPSAGLSQCQHLALCTSQPGSSMNITDLPSGSFTVNGSWSDRLPQHSSSGPFSAEVDGNNVPGSHIQFNGPQNTFIISGKTSDGQEGHIFRFTNLQKSIQLCIVSFQSQDPDSISSASSTRISTSYTPSPTQPASTPSNSTKGGTSPRQIAIAVIIPIVVFICLLLFTFYLRRRWKQQKVSVPLPSEGLKLDEPDRLETGSSFKAWSPSQSPFLPEHPIPRRGRQPAPPRRGQRHFASFTLSSVSSIPEPPPSVNPPSTVSSRSSVLGIAQATFERLKPSRKDPPDARRGVLRAVNVGDE